ncbi:MAG: phosphoenolpyruvate--protein phosphotransferase [Deltaproteobacteria bacterium]|nr:phosphoenolpyruvate--protein phosphotransferase [Deltaproteobacteria bacterium]MBW2078059.1 phosphoenolpyruvate--protein phosphotransferase [Deltaproteobacteria bacterium]MBW2312523.1 phosphoenolpyruvate--protein phosphotransferase [Deltaproteobacteria bacterium]
MDEKESPKGIHSGSRDEIVLRGITICPGIGIGRVRVLDRRRVFPRTKIPADQVQSEKQRYDQALQLVSDHLIEHIKEDHSDSSLSTSLILKSHQAMLTDEQFHDAVRSRIVAECKNAIWALELEAMKIIAQLEASRSPYLASRAEDVRDLVTSIGNALSATPQAYKKALPQKKEFQILISGDLYPSWAIEARRFRCVAFATESNALSSHAAILLKGFGIPTVGGVRGLREHVEDGDEVIVDAIDGVVIVRPGAETVQKFTALKQQFELPEDLAPLPAIGGTTKDNTPIRLMANIDNPDQIQLVRSNRLEEVGLFRTEFSVLQSNSFPKEEEQYAIYRHVFTAAGSRVVIRTFDIGGDKQIAGLNYCTGQNPALGVRGVRRHLLRHPEELRVQLRAILRAAVGCRADILLPMVTTADEIRQVKNILEDVKEELRKEGSPFSDEVCLGAMIEVPAAAIGVSEILAEVDFVNIGTNDLLQYFVAADRDNVAVLGYENFENKAFLWLLEFIIERAAELGKEQAVTVCGEGASHPELVPILLGLGFRSLSITPTAAQSVRAAIARVDLRSSAGA